MDLSAFVNHSGGALGADFDGWDTIGREYGMVHNRHYWYKFRTPHGNTEISEEDAVEGQEKATLTARQLGRIGLLERIRDPLIIRDWAQVKYAEAVFAIGNLIEPGEILSDGNIALIRQVQGGTGFTVQMAVNEKKRVFVFDQQRSIWFKNEANHWSTSGVPVLTRNFAGIGTRELNENGRKAIWEVYQKTSILIKSQKIR